MSTTVQTDYPDRIRQAVAGMVANAIPATFISRTIEGSDGIGFGVAAAQGDNDKGCKVFGTGDTEVVGISVRERSLDANHSNKFPQYASVRLMTKGVIYVETSVDVEAGDPVYVVPATGAFAKTSASSAVQIVGARWDTSAAAGNLAQVRLG